MKQPITNQQRNFIDEKQPESMMFLSFFLLMDVYKVQIMCLPCNFLSTLLNPKLTQKNKSLAPYTIETWKQMDEYVNKRLFFRVLSFYVRRSLNG